MGLGTIIGGIGGFLVGGPQGAKIGASIGGSLDASRSAKRARSTSLKDNHRQYARLRAAAEEGGFNPLTVLQATGGAGHIPSSTGVPSLASTQSLVAGFQDAADSYAYDIDPMRDLEVETAELRNDLARLQIEELSSVPRAARPALGSRNAGSYDPALPVVVSPDGPTSGTFVDDGRSPTTQIWTPFGPIMQNSGYSDGEVGEARWGDFGGGLYGLGVMAADGYEIARPKIVRAGNSADAFLSRFDPSGSRGFSRATPSLQQGTSLDPQYVGEYSDGSSMSPHEFPNTFLPRFDPRGFLIPNL